MEYGSADFSLRNKINNCVGTEQDIGQKSGKINFIKSHPPS